MSISKKCLFEQCLNVSLAFYEVKYHFIRINWRNYIQAECEGYIYRVVALVVSHPTCAFVVAWFMFQMIQSLVFRTLIGFRNSICIRLYMVAQIQ